MGLLLGLCLPVIILLYFKKKQIIEHKVSNIQLWEEVIREIEGVKKRRLDRYLLLFIQLFIGILLVLAFAQPIWLNSFKDNRITIGIDASISMNTEEVGKSHFDMAKKEIIKYIDNLPSKTSFTLVLLKKNSEVYLEEGSQRDAISALERVGCTKEYLDLENAAQLLNRYNTEKVVVTDKDILLGDQRIIVGEGFNNAGIIDAYYDPYKNEVICIVMNYHDKIQTITVSMMCGEERKDVQRISISPKTESTLFFHIDETWDYGVLNIENKDGLEADNKYIVPLGDEYKKKIVYIGNNTFFQNALENIANICVTSTKEKNATSQNYDAYVIDEEIDMEELPQNVPIWMLKPPKGLIEERKKGVVQAAYKDTLFSNNILKNSIEVKDISLLHSPKGYHPILEVDNKPIMIYGMENGLKRIYSTIDFYKTDMVMKPDFPIFVYKAMEWLISGYERDYVLGDKIYSMGNKEMDIFLWDKKIGKMGVAPYLLKEIGPYKLRDKNRDIQAFVVNPPSRFTVEETVAAGNSEIDIKHGIRDLSKAFVILVLVFLVMEWEVYKRGY